MGTTFPSPCPPLPSPKFIMHINGFAIKFNVEL
jgi:hypothetical protein